MRKSGRTNTRRLVLERLEKREVLTASSWNLAADFAADFSGGLPQNNPNGDWTYIGSDGTIFTLVPSNGSNPNTGGLGAGWADNTAPNPPVDVAIPSYTLGGAHGLPSNAMAGHGPNRIIWRAPADVDMGGVEITGFLTQATFEPLRQMRMQIFKNNFGDPLIDVQADFVVQNNIVQLPTTQIKMQEDDFLTILVDGSGTQGNGVSTFAAFDVNIQEVGLDGDYDRNGMVDDDDRLLWVSTFGQTVTPGDGADGNGDGIISSADYTIWRDNEGNAFLDGGVPAFYTPAAIVVETTGVTLPDGTQLDITGSTTHGLQEAFDRSAEQGWSLFVLPGTYTLTSHLDIEELQLRTFRFDDVTLNFDPSVTDFGIRFDSTMLTDWYWVGGGINAPGAQDGVRYEPRTIHPLDGPLLGTIGVVDSRFHWNVDITAGTNKVTMDTTNATINDISFYFQNVTQGEINHIGSGFDPANIFADARTDDPIPFDLFNTAGRVTVIPPASDITAGLPGTVYLPDGSMLDVTGTTTFGLQEAIDYAGNNNLDLLVFSRGVRNINPFSNLGLYNISSNLVIPDLDGRIYEMYSITLNDGRIASGTTRTIEIGDLQNGAEIEISGQVVGTQVNDVVYIRPNTYGVLDSSIRIQAVVGSNGVGHNAVRIDPLFKNITNNDLIFHEINGGYIGLNVTTASFNTQVSGNLIRTLHAHANAHIGVQIGENSTNAANLNNNTINVRANSDAIVTPFAALSVWGHSNTMDLYVRNTGFTTGARLETSSANNTLWLGDIQAGQAFIDLGSGNTVNFLPSTSSSPIAAATAPEVEEVFFLGGVTPTIEAEPARIDIDEVEEIAPADEALLLAHLLLENGYDKPEGDADARRIAFGELQEGELEGESGDQFFDGFPKDISEPEVSALVAVS